MVVPFIILSNINENIIIKKVYKRVMQIVRNNIKWENRRNNSNTLIINYDIRVIVSLDHYNKTWFKRYELLDAFIISGTKILFNY